MDKIGQLIILFEAIGGLFLFVFLGMAIVSIFLPWLVMVGDFSEKLADDFADWITRKIHK